MKRFSVLFIIEGLIKLTGFLFLPVFLALMNKDEFGVFAFYTFMIGILMPMITLSSSTVFIKRFNASQEKSDEICLYSSFQVLLILIYTLCFLVNFLCNSFVFSYQDDLALLSLLAIGICSLYLRAFLIVNDKTDILGFQSLFRAVLSSSCAVLLLVSGNFIGSSHIVRIHSMCTIDLIVIMSVIVFSLNVKKIKIKINKEMLKNTFRYYVGPGILLTLSSLGSTFVGLYDKRILREMYSDNVLADYMLLVLICSPLVVIITSFQAVNINKFFDEKNSVRKVLQNSIFQISIIFLIVSFGIWLLIQLLLFFGFIPENYKNGLENFPVYGLGVFFFSICQFLLNILIKRELYVLITFYGATTILINFFAVNFFLQGSGVLGAAYSYLVTYVVNVLILTVAVVYSQKSKCLN